MSGKPIVYETIHRVKFSELDPYNHMHTALYPAYFVDHRMESLRKHVGWDIKTLEKLPFMILVRRLEIDFIRPVAGDREITITSFAREFIGPDAFIDCTMTDESGKTLSRCLMVVAYVDKATNHATDWAPEVMSLFFLP